MAESEGILPEWEAEAVSPKKKRKGCVLTGLAVLLVTGSVGALVLNGPGFRLLAHFGVLKALGAAGYSGDLKIEGTIGSGFTLSTADFTAATEDTGQIQFEEISLRYSFLGLLRDPKSLGWLQEFHIRKAQVHLVLPEPGEKTETKPEKEARGYSLPELEPVWGLLAADLLIEDLTLFIHQGNRVYSVEHLELALPKEGSGHLRVARIALPGQADIAGIDATITRGEGFLEIGPLPRIEGVSVETLALQRLEPAGIRLDTKVAAAGGRIEASVALEQEARFSLRAGLADGSEIDLAKLPVPATRDKLTGKITALSLNLEGVVDRPASWRTEGKVLASGIAWQGAGIDAAQVLLQQNVLTIGVRRGEDELVAKATVPLPAAETLKELGSLPVEAGLSLAVPDLATTLAAFGVRQPVTGSLRAEGKDFRFSKDGLFSGVLEVGTEGLTYDREPAALTMNAQVAKPDFLEFAFGVGLDAESAARASGNYDLKAKRYEAKASLGARMEGAPANLLTKITGAPLTGALHADFEGSGTLTDAKHVGKISLQADQFTFGAIPAIDGALAASYTGATAVLERLEFTSAGLSLHGTGIWNGERVTLPTWQLREGDQHRITFDAELPLSRTTLKTPDENAPISLKLAIDALALESLAPFLPQAARVPGRVDGGIEASGSLAALKLGGELSLTEPATTPEESPPPSRVKFTLNGPVKAPNRWDLELEALIGRILVAGRRLEGIALAVETEETAPGRPLLARVRYTPRDAIIDANLRVDLSAADALEKLGQAPIAAEASVEITELATVLQDLAVPRLPLRGSLSASLTGLRLEQGSLRSGDFHLSTGQAQYDGVALGEIKAEGKVAAPDVLEAGLVVAIDSENRIEAGGRYELKPKSYEGNAKVRLDPDADSGRLRDLLERTPVSRIFPTSVTLDWNGSGALPAKDHRGKLDLAARGLTLANGSDPLRVDLSGIYEGASAELPKISIAGATLSLDGSLRWQEKRLDLSMKGLSAGREALDLRLSAPLDPDKLTAERWFGQEESLSATIRAKALSIQDWSRWLQAEPKLLGLAGIDVALSGSPARPALEAKVNLAELSVPRKGAEQLAAGKLDLSASGADGGLALQGIYQHPDVKPLMIDATLPFHPGAWARKERKITDETIAAKAKMEKSSLAFLKGQVPGIETIEGEIALNAEVGGTIGAPLVKGSGGLTMSSLRFENRLAPSLQDIALEANFADNAVRIDRLSALVAGGTLEGKGGVKFQPGGEPQVDFGLKGAEVLIFRNTDVSVRTDLDVALSGPFSKVAVSGSVGLTNCRYFRNFDLLPVGMPTKKTASVLPTVERAPQGGGPAYADLDAGVKAEPFKNWPLDLRIYTKDPFLIRSNLVESSIEADLKITGDLGKPNPVGNVAIAEGDMSLPFSKVNVETGRIVFDQATGFNGAIEFKARGKADQYRISIYVYDRIFSPQYVLTSIPPLPSEDIMTLLVTGTTRSELTGGDPGSLAAGKAAGLLLKNLRQKSNKVDGERTLLDALEERTELELGRVNQETGEQTFGGRIRLWKQLFFVGDVDVESDYRALLKYVFRLE